MFQSASVIYEFLNFCLQSTVLEYGKRTKSPTKKKKCRKFTFDTTQQTVFKTIEKHELWPFI